MTQVEKAYKFIKEKKFINIRQLETTLNINGAYSIINALKDYCEARGERLLSDWTTNFETNVSYKFYWIQKEKK